MAILGMPGGWEWLIILAIGLLLFGSRLPEIGRSLGRSIVEFKKGVKGIEEEIDTAEKESSRRESSKPALASSASDARRVSTTDSVEEKV